MMKFDVINTYERRPVRQSVSVVKDESEPPQCIGLEMFQERYMLELKIGSTFWANPAQFDQKRRQAEKMARAHLFKDMIPVLERISLEANDPNIFDMAQSLKAQMINGPSDE